jgi:hypothetical protein
MISGEEIQRICDVYVGYNEDLYGNPVIAVEAHKHLALHNIQSEYDNPVFIFCYPHRIHEFYQKIEMFINPFVLVTHNSDYTVTDKDIYILTNKYIYSNIGSCHHKYLHFDKEGNLLTDPSYNYTNLDLEGYLMKIILNDIFQNILSNKS